MSTTTPPSSENEVTILARLLGAEDDRLSEAFARDILRRRISGRDRARMHDLAVRNQAAASTPAEREELHSFAKASTLLSILKARARRTLGVTLDTRAAH
jgi:hypothetical protein